MRHTHAPAKAFLATLIGAALSLLLAFLPAAIAGTGPASAALPAKTHSKSVHAAAASAGSPGYWEVAADGGVYQFGTTNYGGLRGTPLNRPIVGGAPTDTGQGYWLVASDGGIFSFGDAGFHGSTGNIVLNKPIVGMAADPITGGYWMVASDGGIFSFGAPFYGSTGSIRLNRPIVGMAPTPTGHGYWLVASDGGIFSFGDAKFYGSTGNIVLNKPVVGMAATSDGFGYWLVASDGGIFSFGDAHFHGSTGNIVLNRPIIGMNSTATGNGYWMAATDGGIFSFGDARFLGSAASGPPGPAPIVAMLATDHAYPFAPGATGYDVSQFQCGAYIGGSNQLPPPGRPGVAVVQVTGGVIYNPSYQDCYKQEAAWAGPGMSAYIFMSPMPSPVPSYALGACNGDLECEAANYGYYWATHWVAYARSQHTNPNLWWLDVETSANWSQSPSVQPINAQEVAGAVAGLRSSGVIPGLYSTNYQWALITGYHVTFPGIALWMAGATNMAQAPSFCSNPPSTNPLDYYDAFAGGTIVLVQAAAQPTNYGYKIDEDYACQ